MKLITLRKRGPKGQFLKEPLAERFWRAVTVGDKLSCWEWQGNRHYKGYGEIMLEHGVGDKAHRVAWRLTFGNIPKGFIVCHKCDNPPCCNPHHLFLGTHKTNRDDCVGKRRHAFGVNNPKSKLTEDDVRMIRRLDTSGMTRLAIAKDFGISGRNVTAICRHESWAHVKPEVL